MALHDDVGYGNKRRQHMTKERDVDEEATHDVKLDDNARRFRVVGKER